jgi:uncharacterized protein (TIGR02246 family)
MRHAISLLLLLCIPSLTSARDSATELTKARQDIQSLLARLASAEKAGDAAAVSLCYEGDGLLLPSSGEPVKGREDISKRYQAIFAGKTPRLPLESEELWVMDDWAVSRGATRAPSARKNVKGPVRNRYVMTLKRHGDAWEIQSLVWNSAAAAR